MNFRNACARQPEILRSVQKDARYTNELAEDLSDVLRLMGTNNWIKYNQMCKLLAELTYHGFATINNIQTLGEEYTGIIQVDGDFKQIPSRLLQMIAIILEFGGDALYLRVLHNLEQYIDANPRIVPEAKEKLKAATQFMRSTPNYIKALHKSLFYLYSGKYQLSKRFTSINYVLIRHWLQPEFSLYGYRILGIITLLQLTVNLAISAYETMKQHKRIQHERKDLITHKIQEQSDDKQSVRTQCVLCLEPRTHSSLTPCGHIFCWSCILDWLDEREECPLCRENVKKSQIIQLQNYS